MVLARQQGLGRCRWAQEAGPPPSKDTDLEILLPVSSVSFFGRHGHRGAADHLAHALKHPRQQRLALHEGVRGGAGCQSPAKSGTTRNRCAHAWSAPDRPRRCCHLPQLADTHPHLREVCSHQLQRAARRGGQGAQQLSRLVHITHQRSHAAAPGQQARNHSPARPAGGPRDQHGALISGSRTAARRNQRLHHIAHAAGRGAARACAWGWGAAKQLAQHVPRRGRLVEVEHGFQEATKLPGLPLARLAVTGGTDGEGAPAPMGSGGQLAPACRQERVQSGGVVCLVASLGGSPLLWACLRPQLGKEKERGTQVAQAAPAEGSGSAARRRSGRGFGLGRCRAPRATHSAAIALPRRRAHAPSAETRAGAVQAPCIARPPGRLERAQIRGCSTGKSTEALQVDSGEQEEVPMLRAGLGETSPKCPPGRPPRPLSLVGEQQAPW